MNSEDECWFIGGMSEGCSCSGGKYVCVDCPWYKKNKPTK